MQNYYLWNNKKREMKTAILTLILIFFSNFVESQTIGRLRLPTKQEIKNTPEVRSDISKLNTNLPSRLDNSLLPYFRGVFTQSGGSCAQAAGIGYTFTYEINRIRNTNAKLPENQFPTHYTYNFLNNGSPLNGSFFTDGWEIIKQNGCPNVKDYGGLYISPRTWLSGYQKYENGFDNRVLNYAVIDVSTPQGLLTLKNWLANHLDGSQTGSLANFAAGVTNEFTMVNDSIIIQWGHQVNHAMTIVGWDDSIKYDFNNDGKYTNNIDINNDGKVDMQDWEKGALIMVNSWGENFANKGKAYFMYRLLALPPSKGGIFANKVWVINVRKHYKPLLTLRTKIYHENRKHLIITAGIAQNLNADYPEHSLFLPLFYKQGGNYPIEGDDSSAIEISLDITPLLTFVNKDKPFKIFLIVKEFDINNLYSGYIYDFAVKDSTGTIYKPDIYQTPIKNNTNTYLSVVIAPKFKKPVINTPDLPPCSEGNYNFQLEANGGTPPYKWNILYLYKAYNSNNYYPVNTSKKLIPNNYDDGYALLPLNFKFPFYGKLYDTLYIGTDGWIKFTKDFDYIRTDAQIIKNPVIGVFCSDLQIYPSMNQGITYVQNNDSLIIHWKTGFWGDSTHNTDFACILYKNGDIKMLYNHMDDIALDTSQIDFAAGISNGDKDNFLISPISGFYPVSYKVIDFKPQLMPIGLNITTDGRIYGKITSNTALCYIGAKITDYQRTGDIKFYYFGKDFSNKQKLFIYPNPASNFVAINFTLNEKNTLKLRLFTSNAQLVLTRKFTYSSGNHTIILDISELPPDIYWVQINAEKTLFNGKLVILR